MLTTFQAVILGVVQGLTEFLPVSSSGHLILARELFGLAQEGSILFDVMLHVATALAVAIYFRKDILSLIMTFIRMVASRPVEGKDKMFLFAIVAGSIPAGILGLLFENAIETAFRSAKLVALALVAGSVLMLVAERVWKRRIASETVSEAEANPKKGFATGLFQSLALIPGMSRSGSTISGALLLGMKREDAVRFSFVLSFPIILGAAAKAVLDAGASSLTSMEGALLVGFAAAFASGLAAIHFLVRFLKSHTFKVFVVYRIILAIAVLLFV